MPAIFDVKTLRVDKNLVIYNQGKGGTKAVRAVKKRVRSTRLSYHNRAKQLDEKLAPGDDSKPFATALTSQFHSGGVIPLVFGTFAEFTVQARPAGACRFLQLGVSSMGALYMGVRPGRFFGRYALSGSRFGRRHALGPLPAGLYGAATPARSRTRTPAG